MTPFPLADLPDWFRGQGVAPGANGSQLNTSDRVLGKLSLLCWTPVWMGNHLAPKKGSSVQPSNRGEMLQNHAEGSGGIT